MGKLLSQSVFDSLWPAGLYWKLISTICATVLAFFSFEAFLPFFFKLNSDEMNRNSRGQFVLGQHFCLLHFSPYCVCLPMHLAIFKEANSSPGPGIKGRQSADGVRITNWNAQLLLQGVRTLGLTAFASTSQTQKLKVINFKCNDRNSLSSLVTLDVSAERMKYIGSFRLGS